MIPDFSLPRNPFSVSGDGGNCLGTPGSLGVLPQLWQEVIHGKPERTIGLALLGTQRIQTPETAAGDRRGE